MRRSSRTGYTNTSLGKTCACNIRINVTSDFGDNTVYLLYELTNYYQVRHPFIRSSTSS